MDAFNSSNVLQQIQRTRKGKAQSSQNRGRMVQLCLHGVSKKKRRIERVLGVDLGIRQIAVLSSSDGKINEFYGSEDLSKHRELIQRREKLQKEKRGDNKKYQALQRLSGKDERFIDNINHNISKDIVEKAKHHSCIMAIKNLKGLRDGATSKELRKMLHRWSYRDLSRKIEYKAEAAGIPLKYVDPHKTSKNCSKCGKENKVGKSKQYKCGNCGIKLNRDLNAARNIAARNSLYSSQETYQR